MSSSNTLANGTYFITSLNQGTSLRFLTGEVGELLVTWHFLGGADQQWVVASNDTLATSGTMLYTVKNVQYGTYISTEPVTSGSQDVRSASAPFGWFMESSQDGFVFSTSPSFSPSWNVQGGGSDDGVTVIMYPDSATAPAPVFLFNSTGAATPASSASSAGSSQTSPPNSVNSGSPGETPGADHGTHVGAIAGGVVGGVVGLFLLFVLFVWPGYKKIYKRLACCARQKKDPNADMTQAEAAPPLFA